MVPKLPSGMKKSITPSFNSLWITLLWTIAILLHVFSLFSTISNKAYLLNDSVIYLTIASNLEHYGIFSQSFFPPLVPDFQRTPLFPFILSFIKPPYILVLQHLLVILWGIGIYQILRKNHSDFAHIVACLFLTIPYLNHLASFVMAETVFFTFFLAVCFFILKYVNEPKLSFIISAAIMAGLASYARAAMLPLLIFLTIMLGLMHRKIVHAFMFLLICAMLLFPWTYRNYVWTGKWFFHTGSEISMYYGRIGGIALARTNLFHQDAALKAQADSIALANGYTKFKSYFQNQHTEENEMIDVPLLELWIKECLHHPWDALYFHARTIFQQITGVGYGMAQTIYQNDAWAYFFSAWQCLLTIGIYGYFFYLGWKCPSYLWMMFALGMIGLLFIHSAAWADGRYRVVTDLWLLTYCLYSHKKV